MQFELRGKGKSAGGSGGGVGWSVKKSTKEIEINIHLSQVYDFHPLIFGSFVAFPEIRPFAARHLHNFISYQSLHLDIQIGLM